KPEPAPRPEPAAPDATAVAASLPTQMATPPPATEVAKPEARAEEEAPEPEAPPKPKVKRVRRVRRWDAPAWVVSAAVHLGILVTLGLITFAPEIQSKILNLNSSLVPLTKGGEEELTTIYADPSNAPRDQAAGDTSATTPGGGGGLGSGVGTGPPSATPAVGGRGSGTARVGEGTSLPSVKVVGAVSGLAMLPSAPGRDLGGGGMIAGDVTFDSSDVGAALDQLAREILRHLQQHKLTVVWLFDESESMKDDQKEIRKKFDRVATELRVNADAKKKDQPLTHAVVGFGGDVHLELEKPTANIDLIGKSIDRLRVEPSGVENTMTAVRAAIEHYSGLIRKDHKLLIVLVTDESGDDGGYIEEARQAAVSKNVPIYVIGRQSLFGYPFARILYVDPVTKDRYWPLIRRGPETADVEMLQYDGLHERWDEQPSGFAPYELARLAKDSGGIYFLLPSEENMRVRQREKAYSIKDLKEYVPAYESRVLYNEKRARSDLRRTMYEIIALTKSFPFRRNYSVFGPEMAQQAAEEYPKVEEKLKILNGIEQRLKALKKARDREPEKRWQAHYDLMLAQVVAYQIQAYEFLACLKEMVARPPTPSRMPSPEMYVEWHLDHSRDPKAPKSQTEKKYAEATKLLQEVIAAHPKTPWADLAQDELNRGFSVHRYEWHASPKYGERAKLVPKY
ncbi:MAG TPA: vWA domain-containing protein, partial [Isosphaeraceae bacterium]